MFVSYNVFSVMRNAGLTLESKSLEPQKGYSSVTLWSDEVLSRVVCHQSLTSRDSRQNDVLHLKVKKVATQIHRGIMGQGATVRQSIPRRWSTKHFFEGLLDFICHSMHFILGVWKNSKAHNLLSHETWVDKILTRFTQYWFITLQTQDRKPKLTEWVQRR